MARRLVPILLVLASVVGVASPVAACDFDIARLAGLTRIDTAVAISRAGFGTAASAQRAVLVRADQFADALAGGPLAVHTRGPLLLTGSSGLDPRVRDELLRAVAPGSTVYLLGGSGALGPAVETEVRRAGFVPRRLAGADRYATAVAVADELGASTIFLATGRNFPDGIVAGAVAPKAGAAVLFTDDRTMPASTAAALGRASKVYAFGDQAAAAAPSATPIRGATRYETSVAAARAFYPKPGIKQFGVATGLNFPDALAGGALVTQPGGGPIILTLPDSLPAAVDRWVGDDGWMATDAYVFGDAGVVSEKVRNRIQDLMYVSCGP